MLEYTSHADVAQGFSRAHAERAQVLRMMLDWVFKRRRAVARVQDISRWA